MKKEYMLFLLTFAVFAIIVYINSKNDKTKLDEVVKVEEEPDEVLVQTDEGPKITQKDNPKCWSYLKTNFRVSNFGQNVCILEADEQRQLICKNVTPVKPALRNMGDYVKCFTLKQNNFASDENNNLYIVDECSTEPIEIGMCF